MSRAANIGCAVAALACAVVNVATWAPVGVFTVPLDIGMAAYFGWRAWETRP